MNRVKRKLLLLMLMIFSTCIMAEEIKFKVATLNVDGLPPKFDAVFTQIEMNPDGPQEAGTTQMSKLIAEKGWDILGVSENFNYNDQLMSYLNNYYNCGTYRGKMEISNGSILDLIVHTDGLNFIWKNNLLVEGESWTRWNKTYGNLESGYDENIEKGYRYYCVKVSEGVEIDVYILHMDAETNPEDIAARESQLTQLADAIIASNNKRPVIVMGDTNCRYTRDRLKELFIDRINADPRFTINDPWIDFQWNGIYPSYGSNSIMTNEYGYQKGEVVDKLFYINNTESNGVTLKADSYLHDTDFSYIDGTPISDHFPIVVNFTIEKTKTEKVTGDYYLYNEESNLFLKPGGWWGTHAMVGEYGALVSFVENTSGEYTIKTSMGHLSHNGDDPYMDTSADNAGTWNLTEVDADNDLYALTYQSNGKTMALTYTGNNIVSCQEYNSENKTQIWKLKTRQDLNKEMLLANSNNPYNATFLLPGANFDRNNADNNLWQGEPSINGLDNDANGNFNAEKYNAKKTGLFDRNVDWDVYQEINVPNGKYRVSCQAFFRDGSASTSSEWVNAELYANDVTKDIPSILSGAQNTKLHNDDYQNGSGFIPNTQASASAYFNAGLYNVYVDLEVTSGKLKLGIRKKDADKKESWTCFDNFQIIYLGTSDEENAVYERVKAAMDDVTQKLGTLSAEAQNAFDNSTVEDRYYNHKIIGDGSIEIELCYRALANAAKAQTNIGADMTYAIVNGGFELGNFTGWTVTPANETVVASQDDSKFTTEGTEGKYLFNTWGPDICPPLKQEVKLNRGAYELKALVASDNNNTVYLFADNNHNEGITTVGENKFVETGMKFIVQGNGAVIGVSGADNGEFSNNGGVWFKADNFRLTYIADENTANVHLKVKKAIDDVTAKINSIDPEYTSDFDISEIVEACNNFTITGDGNKEIIALYEELAEAVKKQNHIGADLSYAIINNSFETGDLTGWTLPNGTSAETIVVKNENNYTTEGTDGEYLFNTWWIGVPIEQTVENLPCGKYEISALYTGESPESSGFYIVANGTPSQKYNTAETGKFQNVTTVAEVKEDGKLTLRMQASDSNGNYDPDNFWFWYKLDNVKLKYLGETLYLDENNLSELTEQTYASVSLNRNIKAGKWNTFVVPFNMSIPEGWEVKELSDGSVADDNYLHIRFADANYIEAGKPYMVRVSNDVTNLYFENIEIKKDINNIKIGNVNFIGVYEPGFVPQGAYFISNNTFYMAADNTNTIKGYRAYITVDNVANINGVKFDINGDETTSVNNINTTETEIIGIYDVNGVQKNKMTKGINILKFNNGTVKKIFIK